MPIYEYKCKSCQQELIVVQSFSDEALKVCQNCSGELVKLIRPVPMIIYRGSGWVGKTSA